MLFYFLLSICDIIYCQDIQISAYVVNHIKKKGK